jgi:hypothetical protein
LFSPPCFVEYDVEPPLEFNLTRLALGGATLVVDLMIVGLMVLENSLGFPY